MVLDAVATVDRRRPPPRSRTTSVSPAGISGADLADRAVVHRLGSSAPNSRSRGRRALDLLDGAQRLRLAEGEELTAHAVVLATGARYRRLEVTDSTGSRRAASTTPRPKARRACASATPPPSAAELRGPGRGLPGQARFGCNLVLLHDDLYRDMSRYLADRVVRSPRVRIWRNSEVTEPLGDTALDAVVLRDLVTEERRTLETRALFVLIGSVPHTAWLGDQILDERGFVLTGSTTEMFSTARPGGLCGR